MNSVIHNGRKNKIIVQLTEKYIKRFWSRVNIKNDVECWNWTAQLDSGGYGIISFKHLYFKAHRISYIIANDFIPEDKPFICHSCDNPACSNPLHLFAGTQKDNMLDMISKNRRNLEKMTQHSHGNRYCAKLSMLDEDKIVELYNYGKTQREISVMFNVHQTTVHYVIKRKNNAIIDHQDPLPKY